MTAPVYLDYHQKAIFLFVINGSPVRPENSGRPVGNGKAARWRRLERGSIRWGLGVEWDVLGEVRRKMRPPPAEHFSGPFNNTILPTRRHNFKGIRREKDKMKTAPPKYFRCPIHTDDSIKKACPPPEPIRAGLLERKNNIPSEWVCLSQG